MFTLSPTSMMIFFSMAAGGGVRGRGNGTARGSIIQAGATIGEHPLFIEAYPQAGGMTTGSAAGRGINGNTSEYPTSKFKKTGEVGKGTNIGKNKIIGVSRG